MKAGYGAKSLLGGILSTAALTPWAKHDRDSDGWLPLWRHMADSAAVAGLLWDEWLPHNVRRLISGSLPDPDPAEAARALMVWLTAVHDLGKATPAFACQVDDLADVMRDAGLEMPRRKQFGKDRKIAPHGLAGQVLLQEWLVERHGWSGRAVGQFGIVPGGHHGVPPGHLHLQDLDAHPELLRTPGLSESVWRRVQTELLDACADVYGVRERLSGWQGVKLPQPVQVLLTAVVIVADWIASNPELFPYFPADRPCGEEERVAAAWQGLSLPPRWSCPEPDGTAAELFSTRFDLPAGARPRPVQVQALETARSMTVPSLLTIEAAMGRARPRPPLPPQRFSPRVPGPAAASSHCRRWPRATACSRACSTGWTGYPPAVTDRCSWLTPRRRSTRTSRLLPAHAGMVPRWAG